MRRAGVRAKAGFTLLEMLLVLAIMGMMAAMLLPRVGQTLDQALAHTEAFKFEQQVLDLRRQAFHKEEPIEIVASDGSLEDAEPRRAQVQLGQEWTYALTEPLLIDAGGLCSATDVEIFNKGRVVLTLRGAGPSCRFERSLG